MGLGLGCADLLGAGSPDEGESGSKGKGLHGWKDENAAGCWKSLQGGNAPPLYSSLLQTLTWRYQTPVLILVYFQASPIVVTAQRYYRQSHVCYGSSGAATGLWRGDTINVYEIVTIVKRVWGKMRRSVQGTAAV